jgi:hypothetical protein
MRLSRQFPKSATAGSTCNHFHRQTRLVGHALARPLGDDPIDREGCHSIERLAGSGEWRIREARHDEIVEASNAHVAGNPQPACPECLDSSEGHTVVGGNDCVKSCSTLQKVVGCRHAGGKSEITIGNQLGIKRQSVSRKDTLIYLESGRCIYVVLGPADESYAMASVFADNVLDDGFHPQVIVDDYTWNTRQLEAKATQRHGPKRVTELPEAINSANGPKTRGNQHDAVGAVGMHKPIHFIVGRTQSIKAFKRATDHEYEIDVVLNAGVIKA